MNLVDILFIVAFAVIFYTYIGYGILIYFLVRIKKLFISGFSSSDTTFLPNVTIIIPAYNEEDYIKAKMENTRTLNYPKDKLTIYWVTDGSNDQSVELLKKYSDIRVFHEEERKGKINAINRVMPYVQTPITIFTDANALLSKDSVLIIARKYKNPQVGCVSGEKRIVAKKTDKASGSGEGFYWKYESFLKKLDNQLYSVVGAAGELFSIRTQLFEKIDSNTILDDFVISLKIAQKGYKISYDPHAYAIENASASTVDEFKRKVRICAGGIQAIIKLKNLLNIFKYGILSFQYISHRVLRWTLAPIFLVLLIPLSLFSILKYPNNQLYLLFFFLQSIFYFFTIIGYHFKQRRLKFRFLFIPYYFLMMNTAAIFGMINYFNKCFIPKK